MLSFLLLSNINIKRMNPRRFRKKLSRDTLASIFIERIHAARCAVFYGGH